MPQHKRHPDPQAWIDAVHEALKENPSLKEVKVLAGDRRAKYAQVRWRAWKTLRTAGYSVFGIAVISGFDHTTVLHGLRRLEEITEVRNVENS